MNVVGRYCMKGRVFTKPEFNVGRNTLNIVYSQILVW